MGQMVTNREHPVAGKSRQIAAYLLEQRIAGEDLVVELCRYLVFEIEVAIGSVVGSVSDFVDLSDGDAGFGQAKPDGMNGKSAGVLVAGEALFLGGGDQPAVKDQRGSAIHPLRDPIFAIFQFGPQRLPEGNRILQAANSQDFRRSLPVLACNDTLFRKLSLARCVYLIFALNRLE